jgi:hypothetical protein
VNFDGAVDFDGAAVFDSTVDFNGAVDFDSTVDMTGATVTATTQAISDNSTKVATTAYVDRQAGQVVSTQNGALATGTTTIPADNTIPQITEGDQYMTLAITPKSATSRLVIDIVWQGSHSAGTYLIAALFQDATANALAAIGVHSAGAGSHVILTFRHVMTSGTTSATTFRVRAGSNSAGTTTFNNGFFNGVMASTITICEVL